MPLEIGRSSPQDLVEGVPFSCGHSFSFWSLSVRSNLLHVKSLKTTLPVRGSILLCTRKLGLAASSMGVLGSVVSTAGAASSPPVPAPGALDTVQQCIMYLEICFSWGIPYHIRLWP